MEKTQRDPAEYIRSLPDAFRDDVHRLDEDFTDLMRGEEKTMWEGTFWGGSQQSIIGYGELVQPRPHRKTVEWFTVGLTAQQDYISVYINAVGHGQYVAEQFGPQLGNVTVGKSVIRFRSLSEVELPALLDVVRRARALTH